MTSRFKRALASITLMSATLHAHSVQAEPNETPSNTLDLAPEEGALIDEAYSAGHKWFERLPLHGEHAEGTRTRLRQRQWMLSALWTFASLNYLYCDLFALMDPNTHREYEAGLVSGLTIDENFLAGVTVFMQVPLAMVFLSPMLSPRRSRIANIAAGVFMTAAQTASLFVGSPTKYYVVSSVIEISTTAFITAYAAIYLKPTTRLSPSLGFGGGASRTPMFGGVFRF